LAGNASTPAMAGLLEHVLGSCCRKFGLRPMATSL
jgi:hypothetical protein